MINKHAFLILFFGGIFLAIMGRACAHPAESEPQTPPSATWAPGQADPRSRAWLPVTGATVRNPRTVGAWGVWSWVDVAVARADGSGKPTAGATPTRSATPSPTHPPRPTRLARATGTPTQGRMASPVPCGPGTVEPGLWTPWPACYPHGPSFTPTPAETFTPTPSDTPPASATWEPTPTHPVIEGPAPRVVPLPEVWVYRFPMLLVWRVRR